VIRPTLIAGSAALLMSCSPALAQPQRVTGIWEGTLQRGTRAQPIALLCRPRGASITGMVYLDGEEFGLISDALMSADSLVFRVADLPFLGALNGDRLDFTALVPRGGAFTFSLTHTSSDTTHLPSSVPHTAQREAGGPSGGEEASAVDTVSTAVMQAHAVPAGTTSSLHPALERGTLLLVGGGPTQQDIMARFVSLAGGPDARIVVIPTAADISRFSHPGFLQDLAKRWAEILGVKRVTIVHTFSRKEADSEAFVRPIREADAVWIPGGEGNHLLNSYMGTRTEREWIALLERGGVVGGTSAGALIWGSTTVVYKAIHEGQPYDPLEDLVLLTGTGRDIGLGLLRNVVIDPHFTELRQQKPLRTVVAARPGLLGLGIDESTAIEVHGSAFRVLGRGHVTIFNGSQPAGRDSTALDAGARYDLEHRVPL
jgi:cyanophycinase